MNSKLKYINVNGRIVLPPFKIFSHYSIALLTLVFPVMDLYDLFFNSDIKESLLGRGTFIFASFSILIAIFKWRELKFQFFNGQLTDKQFENAVYATANMLNWKISEIDKEYVVAEAHDYWMSRDPQLITIIRTNNSIAVNSMIDAFLFSVPDLFGVNRTSENTFLTNLKRAQEEVNLNDVIIKELKDEEERIENEPEWSFKNILKRMSLYFQPCLFCFGIGILDL